jgi:hypothetical protein
MFRRPALALGTWLAAAAAAADPSDPCRCGDLPAIRDELALAVALEDRMLRKAPELEKLIQKVRDDPKDRRDPKEAAKDAYERWIASDRKGGALYRLPPSSGPKAFAFDSSICDLPDGIEGKLRGSAACAEIGDALVAHEKHHRLVCNRITSEKHGAQPAPKVALEEADAYRLQARKLRDLLARVASEAHFTYSHVITADRTTSTESGRTTGPGRVDLGKDEATVIFPTWVEYGARGKVAGCALRVTATPGAATLRLGVSERIITLSPQPAQLEGTLTFGCPPQTTPTPVGIGAFVIKAPPLADGKPVERRQRSSVITVGLTCAAP